MPETQEQTAQVSSVQDFMGGRGGSVAQRLLANRLDLNTLRPYVEMHTNATLRKDEWEELDRVMITAFRERLVGIQDLVDNNLVHPLGGLGTLVSQYNRMSEKNRAQVSMKASTDAEQSRVLFDLQSVPIPVIFSEFQLDIRLLESSRRLGDALDTVEAEETARVVGEELETILFNGNTTAMGGMPIYGYRTHPNRNTAAGASWGTSTNIYPNILQMVAALSADRVPGPYVLYLHNDQYMESLAITDTTRGLTERQVALNNIPMLQDIKIADKMTAGEGIMVSMNRQTVDLARAEDFMPVEWDSMGGLAIHYRGMTVAAPRVKADMGGRCGVYHITGI